MYPTPWLRSTSMRMLIFLYWQNQVSEMPMVLKGAQNRHTLRGAKDPLIVYASSLKTP